MKKNMTVKTLLCRCANVKPATKVVIEQASGSVVNYSSMFTVKNELLECDVECFRIDGNTIRITIVKKERGVNYVVNYRELGDVAGAVFETVVTARNAKEARKLVADELRGWGTVVSVRRDLI